MRNKLERNGISHSFVFLNDIVVYTSSGRRLPIFLYPEVQAIRLGKILTDTVIIATSLSKYESASRGHDGCFLILHDWVLKDNPDKPTEYNPMPLLQGYLNCEGPLCNPIGSDLCTWSLAATLEPPNIHLKRVNTLQALPRHILNMYDNTRHNLRNLERQWSSLQTPWPLCLRVIAKSKDRMIIKQEDGRKPLIFLTTLLVADATGYCKLLVWDNAVLSFQNLAEGEQIVLSGRYTVRKAKPLNNEIYFLEPKVRTELSYINIELKLNECDLDEVYIVGHAVQLQIPPSIWNFSTVSNLLDNKVAHGRIVDLIGMVQHHGRWERESCIKPNNSITGQFWIRVWFKLVDHTNLQLSTQSTHQENFTWIKMYVDVEKMRDVQDCVPGKPALFTNLLVVHCENQFSHLESTNESQVFPGDQAFSSRFMNGQDIENMGNTYLSGVIKSNNDINNKFKMSLLNNKEKWRHFDDGYTFAGSLVPPRNFNQSGSFLRAETEILDYIKALPFLTTARIQIHGIPVIGKMFKIDSSGSYVENESFVFNSEPNLDEDRYGDDLLDALPSHVQLVRKSSPIYTQHLDRYCYLSYESRENDDIERVPSQVVTQNVLLVLIQSVYFKIWVSSCDDIRDELSNVKDVSTKYCIDLFRYKGSMMETGLDGVEATLRKVLTDDKDGEKKDKETPHDTSSVSTQTENQTLDFIRAFS